MLTPKQDKFVNLYLSNGRNGAEAYRRAYNSKASPQRMAEEACKLLRNPKIAPIIENAERKAEQALEKAAERYAISKERVLGELARMGFSNMADYTRVVGTELIVDLSKASRDELAAVQEITVEDYMDGRGEDAREVRRTKFKLHGKEGPLEKIAKIMGYVIDRREQGSPGDFTALSDEELKQRLADELLAGGIPEEVARAFIRARSSE